MIQSAAILENLNHFNDHRNQPLPNKTVWINHPDGSCEEVKLPLKWAVCSICNGEGKHVNPNIDAGGLGYDNFEFDEDFHNDYLNGTHDITCNRCNGRTTERVIDYDAMTDEMRDAYEAEQQAEAECRAQERGELMMGA